MTTTKGRQNGWVQSLDWTTGLDYWTGLTQTAC